MTKLILGKRGVPIISRNHRCVKPTPDRSREKIRKCLKCRADFLSQHAGVRMCDGCRKSAPGGLCNEDVEFVL